MTEQQLEFYKQWVDLETRGEAICRTHARHSRDDDQRAKWTLLAELESSTKGALVRFLRGHGVAVEESSEMRREGEIFAREAASVPWLDLMARMQPRLASYTEELRVFASTAPAPQQAMGSRLFEHEEALLEFVRRELAGDAGSSAKPIREHLAKWSASKRGLVHDAPVE